MMYFKEVRKKESKLQGIIGLLAILNFISIPVILIISFATMNKELPVVAAYTFGIGVVLYWLAAGKLVSRTYTGSSNNNK